MANNSGTVGCLVLVGIGAVIAGAVYGVKSCNQSLQTRPFASHLSEYTNISNLKEATSALTTFSGKAISIDKTTSEVDETFFDLPSDVKATKPEEVTTVVWVSCTEHEAGSYTSGSKAYVKDCDVTVIDTLSDTIIGKRSFTGESPPQRKSYRGDWHGSKPNTNIIEYIKSLKR